MLWNGVVRVCPVTSVARTPTSSEPASPVMPGAASVPVKTPSPETASPPAPSSRIGVSVIRPLTDTESSVTLAGAASSSTRAVTVIASVGRGRSGAIATTSTIGGTLPPSSAASSVCVRVATYGVRPYSTCRPSASRNERWKSATDQP